MYFWMEGLIFLFQFIDFFIHSNCYITLIPTYAIHTTCFVSHFVQNNKLSVYKVHISCGWWYGFLYWNTWMWEIPSFCFLHLSRLVLKKVCTLKKDIVWSFSLLGISVIIWWNDWLRCLWIFFIYIIIFVFFSS